MSTRVSDGRRQNWFWLGNEIIDEYAAKMRPMALAVYVYLCRRADREGKCWPSQRSMAEDLGIERGTARTAVKRLVELKLLRVEVRRNDDGSHKSTLYTLLEPPEKAAGEEQGGGLIAQGGPNGPEENPQKEGVEEFANAHSSSGKPQSERVPEHVVGLEKYVTDRVYTAIREAGYRLPNEHFAYHLGRAQDMLAKDDPTDEELESLPAAFVRLWEILGKADAPAALMEMRRQKRREEVLKASQEKREAERPPWESPNPQGERAGEFSRKSRPAAVYLAFYPDLQEQAVKDWIAEGLSDEEILERCDAA